MEDLIHKISRPIIFYFPRIIMEENTGEDMAVLDDIGMTNTLICINPEGKAQYFESGFEPIMILGKEKVLKANIFELLKMKSSLDKDTFYYLLDNYFIEVNTWINTTKYISTSAKNETLNYIPGIQNYLDYQHRLLNEHKKELMSHFGYWKMSIEMERVFKLAPPTQAQLEEYQRTSIIKSKESNIKPKSKKPKRITEKEVDAYILQNVFNLNPNKKA